MPKNLPGELDKPINKKSIITERQQAQTLDNQLINSPRQVQFLQPIDHSPSSKVNKKLDEKGNRYHGYGHQLKEQISLKQIETQNQLSYSRKIDIDNASYLRQKYPFGNEGVKVCQEVVEKYKASNYTIQKDTLEKFQRQAEQFRRNKNIKYRRSNRDQQNYYKPTQSNIQNNYSLPLLKQSEYELMQQKKLQMERLRQKQLQQDEIRRRKQNYKQWKRSLKNEFYHRRQKQNLVKVGNLLREIDSKLKQNSSRLNKSIQNLRNTMKPSANIKKVNEQRLLKIVQKISQNSQICTKIPVIIYNNKVSDPQLYHNQSSRYATRIKRKQIDDTFNNMTSIISILRKNEERLQILTEDRQEINCDGSFYGGQY